MMDCCVRQLNGSDDGPDGLLRREAVIDQMIRGQSLMAIDWGDIGPAAFRDESVVQGKLGFAMAPAALEYYDWQTRRLGDARRAELRTDAPVQRLGHVHGFHQQEEAGRLGVHPPLHQSGELDRGGQRSGGRLPALAHEPLDQPTSSGRIAAGAATTPSSTRTPFSTPPITPIGSSTSVSPAPSATATHSRPS